MIKPADNPLLNYFVNNSGRVIHKWLHYFEIYHRYLDRFRAGDTVDLLEIGIQNGGSAAMWRDYFGASKLRYVGVDIDPRCANLRSEGFEVHIGDQASRDFWQGIKARHSRFDVILDDGGHTMDQQIVTFRELFPLLKDGGVYLCEDTHTSYLEEFGGGLKRPGTFIELVKNLIDDLHGWYYQEDAALASGVASYIDFVDGDDTIHYRMSCQQGTSPVAGKCVMNSLSIFVGAPITIMSCSIPSGANFS